MDSIDNQNQNLEHIERKRLFSDVLMDFLKCGYGKKKGLITEKEFPYIKNYKDENEIFKLTFKEDS